MDFKEWLMTEKNYSPKESGDTISRLRRVQKLLNSQMIQDETLIMLENTPEFKNLTVAVKSQIRRAVRQYLEFSSDQ